MLGCLGPQGPARFNLNFPSRSIFSLSVFLCKEGPEVRCTFNKGESPGLPWPLPSSRVPPCPEETKEGATPSVVTPVSPSVNPEAAKLRTQSPQVGFYKAKPGNGICLREEIVNGVYFQPSEASMKPTDCRKIAQNTAMILS